MAPSRVTLQMSQGTVHEHTSDCKAPIKRFIDNATFRNTVDILLVITILVLLGIAAPVIRGDYYGKLLLQTLGI